jgi:hypothetical protein
MGRDIPGPEAFSFYIGRNGLLPDQGCGELAQRRGGLDAIAALANEPEKAFGIIIEAYDRARRISSLPSFRQGG